MVALALSCGLYTAMATACRTTDRLLLLGAAMMGAAVYLVAAMAGL